MRRRLAPALLLSIAVAHPVGAGVSAQAADAATPSVRELLQTARGQMQRGDRSGALESLGRARVLGHALELEPENIDALAALAEAEAGLDELAPAEYHARRALRRAVAHPTANLVMGIVSMKRERYAEAREALDKAIAANPDSPAAHYQLSLAYARLGDEANAKR